MDKVFWSGGIVLFGLSLIFGVVCLVSWLSMLAWNFVVPSYPITFLQALAGYFLCCVVGGCFKSVARSG